MVRVISYLAIITIYLDDFVIARSPFDVYFFYIIFILITALYVFATKRLQIDKKFIMILSVIFGVSLIKTQLVNYPVTPVIKQCLAMLISSVPYYLIIRLNNFDLSRIFRIYINTALAICVIGVLQEASYLLFDINFNYGYKVTSIVSEPSHLVITLSPAFFVAINKLFLKSETYLISKGQALLVLFTWLLTMSAVAMLGVIAAIGLIALNRYKLISFRLKLKSVLTVSLIVLVAGVFTFVIYSQVPFIKFRVDDTLAVIKTNENKKIGDVNLSTYALYSNALVTKESLKNNPLLGTGLGTHGLNYERYIDKVYNFQNKGYRKMELNKEDANSLSLRLLSELGILGLALFLSFLYFHTIKDSLPNLFNRHNLWLINNGCLLFFILRLLRFGNYSVLGFFLFAFIFYYSYRQHKLQASFSS